MAQENLKLLSVRLDPDTLKKIEKFTNKHTYWKRNSVINNLLTTVINDFSEKAIYDMARRSFFRSSEIKAEYKIINNGAYLGYERKPK